MGKILHVVQLTPKPSATPADMERLFDAVRALARKNPGIERIDTGPNLALASPNSRTRKGRQAHTHLIATVVKDQESWQRFLKDPEHQRIHDEFLEPLIESRDVIDLELS